MVVFSYQEESKKTCFACKVTNGRDWWDRKGSTPAKLMKSARVKNTCTNTPTIQWRGTTYQSAWVRTNVAKDESAQ